MAQTYASGTYTRIEFFDACFHHHDNRPPLWCVRKVGMGQSRDWPQPQVIAPTDWDDFLF
jgi:hypothetical protein